VATDKVARDPSGAALATPKLIASRVRASEAEKQFKILETMDASAKTAVQTNQLTAVPPTWVCIDEAQNILPPERRTSATNVLVKYVREDRNCGLSFIVATQQPTAVDSRNSSCPSHRVRCQYLCNRTPDRRLFDRRTNHQELQILGQLGATFGPDDFDPPQPSPESLTEALVSRVMRGSQLALQAVGAKQRYPRDLVSYGTTLPHNPDIEIQQAGGIGQARDHLALHWDAVLVDLSVKSLSESDDVRAVTG
jgi:hypothetical protein